MGNGVGKLSLCFAGDAGGMSRRKHDIAMFLSKPLDEGLGHSFCYIRRDPPAFSSSKVYSDDSTSTPTFSSISGAAISANTSTPLSTTLADCPCSNGVDKASTFASSDCFASIPLQPIPRNSIPSMHSGPISCSAPMDRGFLSGPIERSFISCPLENQYNQIQRNRPKPKKRALLSIVRRAIAKSIVVPIRGAKEPDCANGLERNNEHVTFNTSASNRLNSQLSWCDDDGDDDEKLFQSMNLQWAQGKAGEDRVHMVVSEEHGWAFVGIYDGFSGPDATDFLLTNLYSNLHQELKGLLWDDKPIANKPTVATNSNSKEASAPGDEFDHSNLRRHQKNSKNRTRRSGRRWEESQRRWKCEWDRERAELDRMLKEQSGNSGSDGAEGVNHSDVLKALSEALRKTEESYLQIADLMLKENPELCLMGSCALVMLMKGEDVYLMNVGDSRAVLARKAKPELWMRKAKQDLERINEENLDDLRASDGDELHTSLPMTSLQLTMDHGTSVDEEVRRIRGEHRDDPSAVINGRVKGSLKVTRAFGAGYLKQPKWNNALLEMFRVDYVGNSPYINCLPSLYHHRLSSRDSFLILSSDGLYQYFTNEEAVSEVDRFMATFPEGDPAQHLVEEVLFRAAKKAGMDFHELLDIPQGDRRRYHDDVSIIIISLKGRIWRSSV